MVRSTNSIPWIISAVLFACLFVALQSRQSWKQRSSGQEERNELLMMRIMADASLLKGDHKEALQAFEELAATTGDSTLLEQRRAYISAMLASGDDDQATMNARLDAQLKRSEQLIARYQGREQDLRKGRERLKIEERQLQELYGSHIDQQARELDRLQAELEARSTKDVLRFPSAKKAEEVIYLGEVRNGKAQGTGFGMWRSGSTYQGHWVNNLRHGQGEFNWPDGERYQGQYVDDRRTGRGVYFWKNGQRWEGEWLDDMRHGPGTLYEANGKVRVKGVWEKDKLVETIKDGR